MERKKALIYVLIFLLFLASCRQESGVSEEPDNTIDTQASVKSIREIKEQLEEQGFKTFDYVVEATKDTVLMQQYFMVFLKRGPNQEALTKTEGDSLQALHLAHLGRMYEEGYADISGPFGDDGEIRGITIYNTPTLEMADSLAHLDPLVKLGRLEIEVHPWWAGKGFPLR